MKNAKCKNEKCKMMASAIAGQWIFGIILALLGQLFGIPAATEHLHLDLPAQARLLLTLFTGQLLFTAAVGRIVDRIGSTRVLGTGSLLMSAAVFLLALAPGFGQAAVAVLIMSLGGACVNAAANTLVSTVYGNLRGPMLNVLGVFGAAGAVSVPLAFSGASTYPHVRGRLIALAAACASIGVLQLLQPAPQSDVPGQPARGVSRAVPRDPWLLALVVVLVIDFGAEAVMAGWIAPYTLAAVPLASPTTMLGCYWGALASGRMLMPLVLARTTKLVLLATAASVAALGLLAISAVRTPLSLALWVAVTGLTLSPMAPTTLSVAGDRYERHTGTIFGVLLAIGQLGAIIMPWSVARVAGASGFRTGMLVPCASAVVMAAVLWWLARRSQWARANTVGRADG
jgi:nitrate/nitrite transporter NarK